MKYKDTRSIVLAFVVDFIKKNGYSPSVREVSVHTGKSVSTSFSNLKTLDKLGYIKWTPGTFRSIVVLKKEIK